MNYQENVRAAAAALQRGEDANWELARLTQESTLDRGDVRNQGEKVTMDQWCADVRTRSGRKFSNSTGYVFRRIWRTYGPSDPGDRPEWTEAEDKTRGSQGGMGPVPSFNRAIREGTPEDKRDAFLKLSRDHDVVADPVASTAVLQHIVRENPVAVQEAWKDTETNIGLSTARWEARDELLEPQRQAARASREVFEPKDSTLDRRIFLADIATKVEQWTRELSGIREFLEFSDDVDRIRRWATRQALDRLVEAATACRDALPSSYEEQEQAPVPKRERRKLA